MQSSAIRRCCAYFLSLQAIFKFFVFFHLFLLLQDSILIIRLVFSNKIIDRYLFQLIKFFTVNI